MGQSLAEFDMKWRHWQQECVRRLDDREFAGTPLETIVKVRERNKLLCVYLGFTHRVGNLEYNWEFQQILYTCSTIPIDP